MNSPARSAPVSADLERECTAFLIDEAEALDRWELHRWLAMLESGEAKSLKEIATREGIDNSYVSRIVNLTTLAPDIVAAILDDQGRPLPPGQVGRLAIKGPTGCKYLDDPRQSQYVQNGWNLTGDAYLLDEDGHYVYQARTDDMIISGGYNIAGPEVESALMLHPAVAECGVVGVPDEDRGQIVKAFVVLRPGQVANDLMAHALQDFVKQTIAPYKYPRAVEFRDSLPRTETGKLQRFKLRQAA